MHENDPDTIMALLDGSLEETRARAVEAHMAECDVCATEFRMQQTACQALRSSPRVYLTASESADLHRSVRRHLGLAAPPASRVPRARRASRLGVLAGVAAVLIAVLAVAPRLSLFGSDDESDATIAFAARDAAQTEDVPSEAILGEDMGAGAASTEASDAASSLAPDETVRSNLEAAGVPDLDVVREAVIAAGGDAVKAGRLLEAGEETLAVPDVGSYASDDGSGTCIDTGLAEFPDTVDAFVVANGISAEGEVVVIAYVPADVEDTVILSQLVESCTIVDRSP